MEWSLKELSVSYKLQEQIGEGVYGKVHSARDDVGKIVALKRVKTTNSDREGFPITSLREIRILWELNHPNIVCLDNVVVSEQSVYLVFEYLEHDLSGLAEAVGLGPAHCRCFARQLFEGVAYMHSKNYLHRDIKASNLLISRTNHLKIGDWGLARKYLGSDNDRINYTNRVCTLWYRPPELLLGATRSSDGYGPAIDVWSIGCLVAELLNGKPILAGSTETDQLDLIINLLGSPDPDDWPGVEQLPLWDSFSLKHENEDDDDGPAHADRKKMRKVRERFSSFRDNLALDLVDSILHYSPQKRVTARGALDTFEYLKGAPEPHTLAKLDAHSAHEWQVRKNRRIAAAAAAAAPANATGDQQHQGGGRGAAARG